MKGSQLNLVLLSIMMLLGSFGCSSPQSTLPQQNSQQQTNNPQQQTNNPQHFPNENQPYHHSYNNNPYQQQKKQSTVNVKGIYVSAHAARSSKMMDHLMKTLDTTELNAMVIDVKNDSGQVTYPSDIELVQKMNADKQFRNHDMKALLKLLKTKQIYAIARLVTFKDPILAASKPDMAIHRMNGGIWRDRKGVTWVDPFDQRVWAYNLDIAKEAAALGFDEIQFDYVRFPDHGVAMDKEVKYKEHGDLSKADAIANFLKMARKKVPIPISADVFGLTTTVNHDMGIGQKWSLIAPEVDYISPMIYPSHYGKGHYTIDFPDLQPYLLVKAALEDANHQNRLLTNSVSKSTNKPIQPAVIRPWLQDFTARWVNPHQVYSATEVKEQIRAASEQGISQYLLWNANCRYSMH